VFTHFHKLLNTTTQQLLAGKNHGAAFKAVRDQAVEILKDVGKDKFTSLIRYFFLMLQSPYSPFPELVPPKYRNYARGFLGLLRSPKGLRLVRRATTPFVKLAEDELEVKIKLPKDKDLVTEDGKPDDHKMADAFQNVVENFLQTPETSVQKLVENKEKVIEKVKGTWQSMLEGKKSKTFDAEDSDDEDWVGLEKKVEKEEEEEEEEETDLSDDLLDLLKNIQQDKSCGEFPIGEYQRKTCFLKQ
jgi:hypothetical protein